MRLLRIFALVALCLAFAPTPVLAVTGYDSAYSGESAFVTIDPGQTQSFQVFFSNTGTLTWTKGGDTQVDLAACLEDKVTCNAQDPGEGTWNSGWLSTARYATTTQATVAPGSLATFSYNIKAPSNATGTHRFNGDLVVASTGVRIHPEGYYQDATVNAVGNVAVPTPTPTPRSTPFPTAPVIATPTPAPTPSTVRISGKVTDDQTHLGIAGIGVAVTDSTTRCCPFGNLAFGQTAVDGTYSVAVPRGTPIKIQFFPFASADPRYIGEWFDNQPGWDQATIRSFTTDTTGIDAALTRGFFIRGHVSRADGSPIEGLHVNANDGLAACCRFLAGAQTNSDGDYAILVRPGTYKVLFFSRGPFLAADGVTYVDQWWDRAQFFDSATQIAVSGDVTGIDAVMTRAVLISGHVTDATGAPVGGLGVSAIDPNQPCCHGLNGTQTDASGAYSLSVAVGASVKVAFGVFGGSPPGTHLLGQWWNNQVSFDTATSINAAADVSNIDAHLANGFVISGHVREQGTGVALGGIQVQVTDSTVSCCPFRHIADTRTDGSGNYSAVVPAGSYKVQFFEHPLPTHPHMPQWWNGHPFDQGADVLLVGTDKPGVDASLIPAVVIRGLVTDAASAPIAGVFVSSPDATQPCCQFIQGSQTDDLGNYAYPVPLGSNVKVQFQPSPGSAYVGQWWNNKPDFGTADAILADGDKSAIDAKLATGFVISGRVTDSLGQALAGFGVNANDATQPCCQFLGGGPTDILGNYRLTVPSGSHVRVFFSTPIGSRYIPEWWENKPSFDGADTIDVTADRGGVNAQLASGVFIGGRVTDTAGTTPIAGLQVGAQDAEQPCCQFVAGARTDAFGNYALVVPQGSSVKIEFGVFGGMPPGTFFVGEWWDDKATFDTADVIVAAADRNDVGARLATGFVISGHVSEQGTGVALGGIQVEVVDSSVSCCPFRHIGGTQTGGSGNYSVVVPAGSYKVQFSEFPLPAHPHMRQWWNGHPFDQDADVLVIATDRTGIDASLTRAVFIRGRVTDAGGTVGIGGAFVSSPDPSLPCCQGLNGTQTDASGNYVYTVPLGSSVKVQFGPPPGSPYIGQWWNNKPDFDIADAILADGDKSAIDAKLGAGLAIRGNVTDRATSLAIANIDVQAFDALAPCCPLRFLGGARTDAHGDYAIVLAAGATVKLSFQSPDPGPNYVQRWWNDKADFESAGQIVVAGDVANINEVLDSGYRISGRVTDAANPTVGVPGVNVTAQPNFSCCFYGAQTHADGRYSIVVSPATYRVSFFSPPGSDFLEQWWNNKPGFSAADLLTVPSSTVDLSSINAALVHGIPVQGTVIAAVGGAAVGQVGVVATLDDPVVPCCVNYQALTASDGTYTVYVRSGRYRINFQPPNTTDYVGEYWDGQPDFGTATLLDVAGPTAHIDATLDRGFRISGRVTDSIGGGAVQNAVITIGPVVCCGGAGGFAVTGLDGTYSATVREGTYKVGFNPPFGSDFLLQYWNNKPNFAAGDPLVVNESKPNIDAVLGHGFRVSGRVYDAEDPTIPLPGANISASTAVGFQFIAGTAAGSDGTYSLFLPAGDYIVSFNGPFGGDYGFEYWNDKPDQASADVLHVTGPMADINAGLAQLLHISGRVTDEAGQPIAGLFVNVDRSPTADQFVAGASTDADGRYSVLVPPGSYKVLFPSNGLPFIDEWWNDKPTAAAADPIDVTSSVTGIDAVLARGVVISGHIKSASGATLAGSAFLADGNTTCCVFGVGHGTTTDGAYSFTVPAGNYFVGFYADGYKFQYWNGKTDPLMADVLSAAADRSAIDSSLAPIDASPPAGSGPPADGTSSGSSGPP